jgi:Dehydratase medium subunit
MTAPFVALIDDPVTARQVAAGFEEEGVPLGIELRSGRPLELAREAARGSTLGLGIGGAAGCLVAVLAAASGRAYIEAHARDARRFGHEVARIVARRPLTAEEWGGEGASARPAPADGGS